MTDNDKLSGGVIALIGAGNGGMALLKVLLKIPDIKIKYVCDINPYAVGVLFARNYDIEYIADYEHIINDKEINLIFEATGDPRIFKEINSKKSPRISLIGGSGSMIIYQLLDSYNEINRNLNEYKMNLEKKIIQRTEEIEKVNIMLEKEMLEYEKISRKLQEINREKSKYLLYATHQLKAPFAAIQSYVDIILEGYSGTISQGTRDIVIKIKNRCELLSKVIKEMLELESIKTQEALTLDKIDLGQLISDIIQRFRIVAKANNITIRATDIKDPLYIKGDKKQVQILFSVLIENAIDYSPPGTTVDIVIRKMDGNQLYFCVKDEGIGIPEKNLDKIFNEFFRSNNAVQFHKNGTGLGLAMAKEIAEIHGTSIHAENRKDKGSCFSMVFDLLY